MRIAIAVLSVLCALPCFAQERIFHASPVDVEQNSRLDALEARLAAIERVPQPAPQVQAPRVIPSPPAPIVQPQVQQSSAPTGPVRYSSGQLRYKIQQMRPGGWRGPMYADVSPRSMAKQHLIGAEHGFTWDQVAGLTQEEALILHDLAPGHGNQIFPRYRLASSESTTVTVRQQAYQPVQQPIEQFSNFGVQQKYDSGCANGQCDRQQYSQQSQGRVPILRRWFR